MENSGQLELEALRDQLSKTARILKARKCKDSLLEFLKYMAPDHTDPDNVEKSRFIVRPHIQMICEALEKVERGEILRLAISMPPRHGKSESCTRGFPAWFVGRDPYRQVILAGYSETFAENEFGAKIRRIIESNRYKQVFPGATLKGGSKAVGNLVMAEGGNIASVGKGGPITGRGADLAIIDDPIKDNEEADSDTAREKLYEWFTSTLMTRMMPGGRCVIIQTRWHESDLIGRICDPEHPDHDPEIAKDWIYINIPAVITDKKLSNALGLEMEVPTDPRVVAMFDAKPMVPLWADRYGLPFFAEIKRLSPRTFTALYQGRPTPDDGDFFKREWLKGYQKGELPKNLELYAASDHAISSAETADDNCFGIAGRDEHGVIWLLDDLYFEKESDTEVVVEEMIGMMERHNLNVWWAEKGHISKAIEPFLLTRMREREIYTVIDDSMVPSKDKKTRARAIQGLMSHGMVRFPTYAPWWEKAKAQMLKFDNGAHDDFVDMMSWIGIGLLRQHSASPKTIAEKALKVGTQGWFFNRSKLEKRQAKLKLAVNNR